MIRGMARLLSSSLLLASLLITTLTFAWRRDAGFTASVHDHQFTRVVLESAECTLSYKLYFSAPPKAYPSARAHYRFHARIQLEDGRSVVTPVFSNRKSGERVYTQALDTTGDGCWAKRQHKLFGVTVEGCRGGSCNPEAFR